NPSATETNPSATETNPSATETNPSATETNPSATETNPSATETNPSATETNPSATETNPSATETNPSATETNPSATESNPSATATISSYSLSSSVSLETCYVSLLYSDITINSDTKNHNYDTNNPFSLPCPGEDFSVSFTASTDYDFKIAFTTSGGLYDPAGAYQISINIVSGSTYQSTSGAIFQNLSVKRDTILKRSTINDFTITRSGGFYSIYVDGTFKTKFKISKISVSQFYLAPFKGSATFSNIRTQCSDRIIPCDSSLSTLPDSSSSSIFSDTSFSISFSYSENSSSLSSDDFSCSSSSDVPCEIYSNDLQTPNYSNSSPIQVPCTNTDFIFNAKVGSDSDIFISLYQDINDIKSNNYVEVQVGIFSDSNIIQIGKLYTHSMANLNGKSSMKTISLSYINKVISLSIDGVKVSNLPFDKFSLSYISISPISGLTSVVQGSIVCASSSC
ncbi:putative surface protein, partial [Smittium culicis]